MFFFFLSLWRVWSFGSFVLSFLLFSWLLFTFFITPFFFFFFFFMFGIFSLMLVFLNFLFLFVALLRAHWLVFILVCWAAHYCQIWKRFLLFGLLSLLLKTFPLIPCGRNCAPILYVLVEVPFECVATWVVWSGNPSISYSSGFFGRPFPKFMASLLKHLVKHTHGFGFIGNIEEMKEK